MKTDHAAEIRAHLNDARAVVAALGLEEGAKRQPNGVHIRCPAHVERNASCSVTTGPDGTVRVNCFGCGLAGDALTLVAAVHRLDQHRDFRQVLELAAAIAGYDLGADPAKRRPLPPRPAPPPAPSRIPGAELEALWSACMQVNRTAIDPHVLDVATAFYLARRGWWAPALAALDLVRVTPLPRSYAWPNWWPEPWAHDHRLVVRAYSAAGEFASLHGRAITPAADPKTRWPRGYAAGFLFADRRGVALLRGELTDTDRLVIVEGLTDMIAMSLAVADARRAHAVIAVTSGAVKTLRDVNWSALPVVVATDHDAAGERYAREIIASIPTGVDVRRTRPTADRKEAAR